MRILIWEVRNAKDINATELAELTGLSRAALYRYENGTVSPTLEKMHIIARALGVRIADLYEEN